MSPINEGYITEFQLAETIAEALAQEYGVEDVCITAQTVGDNDYKLQISGRQTRPVNMGFEGTSVKFSTPNYGAGEQLGDSIISYTAQINPGAGYSSIEVDVELHANTGSLLRSHIPDPHDFGVAPSASLRVTSLVGGHFTLSAEAQDAAFELLKRKYLGLEREDPLGSMYNLIEKRQDGGFPRIVSFIDNDKGRINLNTPLAHQKFVGEIPFKKYNTELPPFLNAPHHNRVDPVDLSLRDRLSTPLARDGDGLKANLEELPVPPKRFIDFDNLPVLLERNKSPLADFKTSQHPVGTEDPLTVLGRKPTSSFLEPMNIDPFAPSRGGDEVRSASLRILANSYLGNLNKDSGEE